VISGSDLTFPTFGKKQTVGKKQLPTKPSLAEDISDDEEDENDEAGDVEHDENRQLLSQRDEGRRRRKNRKFTLPTFGKKQLPTKGKPSLAEDISDDEEDENDEAGDVEHDENRQLLSQREGGRRRRRKNLVKKVKKVLTKGKSMFSLAELQEAEDKSDDEEDDVEHDEKRQLLSQREGGRRRRKNFFKKATKAVVKAVTCFTKNVAKTCNVPKSCNVGESFNDCFNEIKGTVKNAINEGGEYMDMISDTGCTSLNSCKSKVTDGLDAVWNVVDNALGALEDAVVSEVSSKLPNPSGVAKKMADGAGNLINTVGSAAVSIGNEMGSFFSNYQKFDLGDCCLRGDEGAWYMVPTDCGAFSKLGSVFTDMTGAQGHFNGAVDKFEECVTMKGMLGVPTPFFELKTQDLCMPDFIKDPLEYLLGAFEFGGSAATDLVKSMSSVMDTITNFAQNDLGLAQIGKAVVKRRAFPNVEHDRIAQDVAVLLEGEDKKEVHGDVSGACGHQATWSVQLSVAWSQTTVSPTGESNSFGFSIGVLIGCKNDKLIVPQPVFGASIALPTQGAIPKAEDVGTSSSMAGGLSFSDTYASFALGGQANLYNSFDLGVKGSLTALGIPIKAGMAICFAYPPIAAPNGFSFSIPFEFDATLNQVASKVAVSDEHVKHNTQMLVALSQGVGAIQKIDVHHHMKKAFASTSDESRTTSQHATHAALNVDKHKSALLEHAVKGKAKGSPIDIDVGGASNFNLCLLFPCKGQD